MQRNRQGSAAPPPQLRHTDDAAVSDLSPNDNGDDNSPASTAFTNPPTRGSSFAYVGSPENLSTGSSHGNSFDGFSREDEFRLRTLQSVLASHSGNPLEDDEARRLCAEMADLEERQQHFLRLSIAKMQADAASDTNTRAGSRATWGSGFASIAAAVRGGLSKVLPATSGSTATSTGSTPQKLKLDADEHELRASTNVPRLHQEEVDPDSLAASPSHRAQEPGHDDGDVARGTTTAGVSHTRTSSGTFSGAGPSPATSFLVRRTVGGGSAAAGHFRNPMASPAFGPAQGDAWVHVGGIPSVSTPPDASLDAMPLPSGATESKAARGSALASLAASLRRDVGNVGTVRIMMIVSCCLVLSLVAVAPPEVFHVTVSTSGTKADAAAGAAAADVIPRAHWHQRVHRFAHLGVAMVGLAMTAMVVSSARREKALADPRAVTWARYAGLCAAAAALLVVLDGAVVFYRIWTSPLPLHHSVDAEVYVALKTATASVDVCVGHPLVLFWYLCLDVALVALAESSRKKLESPSAQLTGSAASATVSPKGAEAA